MTDDMYDYSLEGATVSSDEVADSLAPILGVQDSKIRVKLDLLRELQHIHDDVDVVNWADKLAEVKLDYHIT
jgi:hypothetical protein